MENNGKEYSEDGNSDSNPRPDGIRLFKPSLQFVLPKNAIANTALIVIPGNPFAKLLIGFAAKAVRIRFIVHGEVMSYLIYGDKPLSP